MIFASACLWFMVAVLLAWGVQHLWSGMVRGKAVNAMLLPGTLVAYIGRTVGLLLTGAAVNPPKSDSADGEPEYVPSISFFGPLVVGLLPMLAVAAALYVLLTYFSGNLIERVPREAVSADLPLSLTFFWDQLRSLVTLAEKTLEAVRTADMETTRLAIVLYLMVCLTVKLSPFPGNAHGHFGAIAGALGVLALAGTLSEGPETFLNRIWPILAVTLGWLLILLIVSLVVRAAYAVVRMAANWK